MERVDVSFFEYDDFGRPLDPETRKRRAALKALLQLSNAEFFAHLVKVGIYHPDGSLTEHYRDDGEPSKHRPTG
jgi:hypothetical protein